MVSVRFARLNFEARLSDFTGSENIQARRKRALREVIDWDTDVNRLISETKANFQVKNNDWGFGGIKSEGPFIYGRIAKEREESSRRKDSEIRDYVQVKREDADIAFFVIDIESMIMAYEYRRNVGPKAPYRVIESSFNGYYQDEESLSATPIVDREEVSAEINRFQNIRRLEFTNLHPTNPHSTDRSDPMDEFLQDSGINNLGMDADSEDEDSIDVRGTPLLDGGLSLAEEGYGSATLTGENELGETKRISTEDNPISVEIHMDQGDERNRERLTEEIHRLLEQLED